MSATMLQQLLQKERYETVNSSSSKCSSQGLTTGYHESSQDSFIHQSTEEIFLESHCNDLELERAALTMLFKSLGKDSLDSKRYRWNLCGAMIGDNCFDIVTNLSMMTMLHLNRNSNSFFGETNILMKRRHTQSSLESFLVPRSNMTCFKTQSSEPDRCASWMRYRFKTSLRNKKPRT